MVRDQAGERDRVLCEERIVVVDGDADALVLVPVVGGEYEVGGGVSKDGAASS